MTAPYTVFLHDGRKRLSMGELHILFLDNNISKIPMYVSRKGIR